MQSKQKIALSKAAEYCQTAVSPQETFRLV